MTFIHNILLLFSSIILNCIYKVPAIVKNSDYCNLKNVYTIYCIAKNNMTT